MVKIKHDINDEDAQRFEAILIRLVVAVETITRMLSSKEIVMSIRDKQTHKPSSE